MGNSLTTLTNNKLMPKVVDTVLEGNTFLTRMLLNAKKWPSSRQIEKSFKYQKNTQGSSFDGFDVSSVAAVDTRLKLTFDPKFYRIPVTISLTDLSINRADTNKVADLAAMELESSSQDMADDLGTIMYSDGTGNGGKDPLGLEAIIDDGTNAATYGGQTRATYTTLNSTVTASAGTLSLAKMGTLYSNCSVGSATNPTLGLTTEDVFDLYEQLLEPQARIYKKVGEMSNKQGLEAGAGFTALYHRGIPIIADEKCTTGVLYYINENYLEWSALPVAMTNAVKYGVEIEGNDYTNVKGLGFSWSDWILPAGQSAITSFVYLGGQLWSKSPRTHGKLTGITSV